MRPPFPQRHQIVIRTGTTSTGLRLRRPYFEHSAFNRKKVDAYHAAGRGPVGRITTTPVASTRQDRARSVPSQRRPPYRAIALPSRWRTLRERFGHQIGRELGTTGLKPLGHPSNAVTKCRLRSAGAVFAPALHFVAAVARRR